MICTECRRREAEGGNGLCGTCLERYMDEMARESQQDYCEYGHYEEGNPIWPRCMNEHQEELPGWLDGLEAMERESGLAMDEHAAGIPFGGSE